MLVKGWYSWWLKLWILFQACNRFLIESCSILGCSWLVFLNFRLNSTCVSQISPNFDLCFDRPLTWFDSTLFDFPLSCDSSFVRFVTHIKFKLCLISPLVSIWTIIWVLFDFYVFWLDHWSTSVISTCLWFDLRLLFDSI